ncbi:MAG: hypothetical protein VX594_00820, partial [Actinomycetota bacterium]|nr:hypothetical protein [Actinomycetota bacterium]
MAEIPEHLLKRAAAAREKAQANQASNSSSSEETTGQTTAVVADENPIEEPDEKAENTLETIQSGLAEKIISSHIAPNRGLWIRVASKDWRETARFLKDQLDCQFFDWLSVIDWMPSPYGRELDTEQDIEPETINLEEQPIEWGYTGGQTRFQLICRVYSISQGIGIMVKADLDDQSP